MRFNYITASQVSSCWREGKLAGGEVVRGGGGQGWRYLSTANRRRQSVSQHVDNSLGHASGRIAAALSHQDKPLSPALPLSPSPTSVPSPCSSSAPAPVAAPPLLPPLPLSAFVRCLTIYAVSFPASLRAPCCRFPYSLLSAPSSLLHLSPNGIVCVC